MKSRWWWVVSLALVVASAPRSGRGEDESGQANVASTPQSEASVPIDTAGTPVAPSKMDTKNLGALVDLIVAEAGDLPRTEFDPAAVAESLGKDPQKLFEWVRDHTWWAPYRGLLRGAKGVMLDRVGSNLDRAVLLGDLMRRAGHKVRLAHAELPEARARELLAKVRPIPDEVRGPVARKPASAERQRAIETVIPGYEKSLQAQIAESKRRSDEAAALVRSQADQLYAKVRDVVTGNAVDDKAAIAALQDHWWVEREDDGKWVTMDVLLPDAAVGSALATAAATSDWQAEADALAIPETDWHTVEIRVVVERYQGGATSESTVLETVLRPADVLERPILLGHLPKPWPAELPDAKTNPNALRSAALEVRQWVPFLQVGDRRIAQSGFTDGGDVASGSADSEPGLGKGGGGDMFGDFGSALGGGEEAPAYATAEWIDYEIRVPGQPNQRLRRTVFDLLGPSKRSTKAAGFDVSTDALKLERFDALWSRTDILLQTCDFTGELVADLMSRSIVANRAAFTELSQEADPAKAKTLASTILDRIEIWGRLPDLALWRSSTGRHPRDWYVDRPNVLNYRVGRSLVDTDRAALRETIDVASNATGIRRGSSRSPFEVRLHQGVADTVAEILTLGSDLRMAENTASVFAMAGDEPDRGVRVGPRDAASVKQLGWPADAAARLAETIDAGFMAVALKQPVLLRERQRVGWWRVDPASGETIGVMDSGFHGSAEDAELRAQLDVLRGRLFNIKLDNYRHWQGIRDAARLTGSVHPENAFEVELASLVDQLLQRVTTYMLFLG